MSHRPCGTTTKDDKSHGMLFESWRIILVNCSGKFRGLGLRYPLSDACRFSKSSGWAHVTERRGAEVNTD
jgi:hypothetical protein